MSKLEKSIGALFTNNHRYIKFDGSGYHSGRLKSIFERAAFNSGAFAVIGLSIVDFLTQSNLSQIDPETYKNLFTNLGIYSTLIILHERHILFNKNIYKGINPTTGPLILRNHGKKAIDKEGRSLSQTKLSLSDLHSLQNGKKAGLSYSVLGLMVAGGLISLYGFNGFIIHSSILCSRGLFLSHICNKLIKGHTGQADGYVFCDEPPAQRQKQSITSRIFGGATSPT